MFKKKVKRLIPVIPGVKIQLPSFKLVYTDVPRKLLEPVAVIRHPYR